MSSDSNIVPIDYLNQIAPKKPSRLASFNNKPLLIAVVLATALFIIIIISSIIGLIFGGNNQTVVLSARLSTTSTIANDSTAKLKSTKLRALNSNLKLFLTNTTRDIEPILTKEGVNIKNIDKKIIAQEAATAMISNLEDARLNAIFDRTYAREMAYQLEKTVTLMQQIYKSTSSNSLESFLSTAYENLSQIQKDFADFNATNL